MPNRRAWDLELPRGIVMARRAGEKLAVAVVDLDHFKAYNDTHGHPTGDELLRQAAAAWRAELRKDDLLARYGGEEFTVMAIGLTQQQMTALVERLRAQTPFGQTFSAGIAEWDGSETPQRLVARADEALYKAKNAGRNRTVTAPAPGSESTPARRATDLNGTNGNDTDRGNPGVDLTSA
ncbi:GGDEF domain-containing protein [Planosporangium flavigriseum]|uniref:GGDEF domain-containing protein n=1 Tax=Planosporangium flavigriseum TaxID=373681 RepID=A0A8J3LWT5_9ACTN|nr:GGDEF domain-containing protein [Planosporangium flavigriseum]GIG75249.1 hypothetical protein Pfl04_36530 [Planosporangium flavigriseum]